MGGIPLLGSSLQSWGKGNLDLCKPQALHSVPLPVPEAFDWCGDSSLQCVCFTEERLQIATDKEHVSCEVPGGRHIL